jgi:hypothetical protein
MYTIMTYFVNPSEREKIPPMITDSNQVRLAKMAGRRVQEEVLGIPLRLLILLPYPIESGIYF